MQIVGFIICISRTIARYRNENSELYVHVLQVCAYFFGFRWNFWSSTYEGGVITREARSEVICLKMGNW